MGGAPGRLKSLCSHAVDGGPCLFAARSSALCRAWGAGAARHPEGQGGCSGRRCAGVRGRKQIAAHDLGYTAAQEAQAKRGLCLC